MQNFEVLALNLDDQVFGVMKSFRFSDSPSAWGTELDSIFPEIHHLTARTTKQVIRAVARFVNRTSRIDEFSEELGDFEQRLECLSSSLSGAVILIADASRRRRTPSQELQRLRGELRVLNNDLGSITNQLSVVKNEVATCLEVFSILEESEDAVELLLSSLPPTIPDTYVTQGQTFIQQLVRLWSERWAIVAQAVGLVAESPELHELEDRLKKQKEEQASIINAFNGLLGQIKEVPPLRLLNREFDPRDFSGASSTYKRLIEQRDTLYADTDKLENTLDDVVSAIEAAEE